VNVPAQGLAGITWQGRVLRGRDRITAAEYHFLSHVVRVQEWPLGTTLQDYLDTIRDVFLDARSGLMLSQYYGQWQLAAMRRSGAAQGPDGGPWILAEYRAGLGRWVTAYQPRSGLRVLRDPRRGRLVWLRPPR